jgi:RND family efflux transporter MFP subunit
MITSPNQRKFLKTGAFLFGLVTVLSMGLQAQSDPAVASVRSLPVLTTVVNMDTSYKVSRSFTGRAIARRTSSLSFEVSGTLEGVTVDYGSLVKKGDKLASLDKARLTAQQNQTLAEREEVIANLNLAEKTWVRTKETFDRGHTSAQRLDEAEANTIALKARSRRLDAALKSIQIDLGKHTIHAPYDGVITSRMSDEGSVINAGKPILEIIENSIIEAHVGMPAEFATAANIAEQVRLFRADGALIDGFTIKSVVPTLNGQTRTMLVTFNLPHGVASHGELINAIIKDTITADGAWIPLRALSSDVRGLWRVYKVFQDANGHYVRFENVQILYTDGDRVYVTGTIADGDIIIADGLKRLAPKQRVRLVPSNTLTTTNK